MILAPKNFRDIEYIVPRSFFEQNGAEVFTASTEETSTGRFGYEVKNDFVIKNETSIDSTTFDGICFVGGVGALDFIGNQNVKNLAKLFLKENKAIGAICAAPRLLLEWGILKNKKCTGNDWDDEFTNLCQTFGAIHENLEIVIDDNIVTAYGPEESEQFSVEFLKALAL